MIAGAPTNILISNTTFAPLLAHHRHHRKLHHSTINLPHIKYLTMSTANGVRKVPLDASTSGSSPDFQSQVTSALLQNGGVARIQATLQQRLDEAGWSQNLRDYVVKLFRTGEATTYDDAWNKVMQQIKSGGAGGPDLSIPQEAKVSGVEVVKRELEGVCEMKR